MKCYLLPKDGTFYKANMHMHTTVSDGRMTPQEVKDAYKSQGYSIVAFTDHEVIVPHNDLRDESFLPITAYEIAFNESIPNVGFDFIKTYHLNLYAKDPENVISTAFCEGAIWERIKPIKQYLTEEMRAHHTDRVYSVACVNDMIAMANKEGFLVSYNHPVWSLQDYSDYAALKGLWGVEVYNTGCDRVGYVDTAQPFDDLLRGGEPVYPLATDDAHSLADCFGGWLMVRADKLEYAEVMKALENGDFYASTGPEIREISIENGVLHVACSDAASVFVSTERRFCKRAIAKEAPLTAADFDLTNYFAENEKNEHRLKPYIRVTVTDAQGYQAWSRAYFME